MPIKKCKNFITIAKIAKINKIFFLLIMGLIYAYFRYFETNMVEIIKTDWGSAILISVSSFYLITIFLGIHSNVGLLITEKDILNAIIGNSSNSIKINLKKMYNGLSKINDDKYPFTNLKENFIEKRLIKDFSLNIELLSQTNDQNDRDMEQFANEIIKSVNVCANGGIVKMTTTVSIYNLDDLIGEYFTKLTELAHKNRFKINNLIFIDETLKEQENFKIAVKSFDKIRNNDVCECRYILYNKKNKYDYLYLDYHICCSSAETENVLIGDFEPNETEKIKIIGITDTVPHQKQLLRSFTTYFDIDWGKALTITKIFPK